MSIFHRERGRTRGGEEVLWIECPFCKEISFKKEVARHLWACPQCTYHHPISVSQRIHLTADEGTFEELFQGILPADPLEFRDKDYRGAAILIVGFYDSQTLARVAPAGLEDSYALPNHLQISSVR